MIKIGQKKDGLWRQLVIPIIVFFCLFIFVFLGVGGISASSDQQSRQILTDALKRATVQCYAIEGMYPPDIQYLEDNYGISYDHKRFIVHYEVFAANILPDIIVIDLAAAKD
jgi:hypothetical protein